MQTKNNNQNQTKVKETLETIKIIKSQKQNHLKMLQWKNIQ